MIPSLSIFSRVRFKLISRNVVQLAAGVVDDPQDFGKAFQIPPRNDH
jgi:hypothetical protein